MDNLTDTMTDTAAGQEWDSGRIVFSRRSSAWLEQRSFKPMVQGSNPCAGTNFLCKFGWGASKGIRLMGYTPSADALQLLRLMRDTLAHEGDGHESTC